MESGMGGTERTNIQLPPPRTVALLAGLVDLEPVGVRRVVLVARRALAQRHVRHERAGVVRPLPKHRHQ